jgi:hypothetical protein
LKKKPFANQNAFQNKEEESKTTSTNKEQANQNLRNNHKKINKSENKRQFFFKNSNPIKLL